MTVSAPIVVKVSDPPPPVKIIPDVALVINFDTNKFNLDATDRALIRGFARDVIKYGFKEIDISGHTDSRGGVDNNVLSSNRAKAARDYLLTLVPGLKVTVGAYADAVNVASNSSSSGMAANRRAEFRIVKY
jgi:peptidoglycan-associated lipoprotein